MAQVIMGGPPPEGGPPFAAPQGAERVAHDDVGVEPYACGDGEVSDAESIGANLRLEGARSMALPTLRCGVA
jgi:hypothetical protein